MKYFEKEAGILDVSDVEDEIGAYFPDPLKNRVRAAIDQQYNKRVGLRHPVLTGIPTLGIWPAASKNMAIEEIKRPILSGNKRLMDYYFRTRENRLNRAYGYGAAAAYGAMMTPRPPQVIVKTAAVPTHMELIKALSKRTEDIRLGLKSAVTTEQKMSLANRYKKTIKQLKHIGEMSKTRAGKAKDIAKANIANKTSNTAKQISPHLKIEYKNLFGDIK